MNSKKGLSAVIATVMLIVLSLVAISILWSVISNAINKETSQYSGGLSRVNLDIIKNSVVFSDDGTSLDLRIKRDTGKGELSKIKIIISDGENSSSFEVNASDMDVLDERKFSVPLEEITCVKEISVAPIVKTDSGEDYPLGIVDEFKFEKCNNETVISCPQDTTLFSTSDGSTKDICAETSKREEIDWNSAQSACQLAYSGGDICPQQFYEDMLETPWCESNMNFGGEGNEESRSDVENGRVDRIDSCSSTPNYDEDDYNEYRCCLVP